MSLALTAGGLGLALLLVLGLVLAFYEKDGCRAWNKNCCKLDKDDQGSQCMVGCGAAKAFDTGYPKEFCVSRWGDFEDNCKPVCWGKMSKKEAKKTLKKLKKNEINLMQVGDGEERGEVHGRSSILAIDGKGHVLSKTSRHSFALSPESDGYGTSFASVASNDPEHTRTGHYQAVPGALLKEKFGQKEHSKDSKGAAHRVSKEKHGGTLLAHPGKDGTSLKEKREEDYKDLKKTSLLLRYVSSAENLDKY